MTLTLIFPNNPAPRRMNITASQGANNPQGREIRPIYRRKCQKSVR
jgi:hypothetical protein